ncbi:hypothetical protein D3C72_1038860 [compost metagenome]
MHALVAQVFIVLAALTHRIVQASITIRVVPVSGQRQVGAIRRKGLCILDSRCGAHQFPAIGSARAGSRDVGGNCPHFPQVQGQAGRPRLISSLRTRHAAVGGNAPRQSMGNCQLRHQRALVHIALAMLAQRKAVIPGSFAQHRRQGRERLRKARRASPQLFDGHFKVAAARRGVKVVYDKRPGRHEGGVDGVAILAHGHLGVGRRDTPHHRGEAPLTVRQHPFVRLQDNPAKTRGIEDVARRRAIAHAQPAAPGGDVALRIQIAQIPVRSSGALVIAAVGPQAPWARVESIPEVGKCAARAAPLRVRGTGGVMRHAVRRPECGRAVVPPIARDGAARLAVQRSLSDGHLQDILVLVVAGLGVGQRLQRPRATGCPRPLQRREGIDLDAHFPQQRNGNTGLSIFRPFDCGEFDLAHTESLAVKLDHDQLTARLDTVGKGEHRKIDAFTPCFLVQKTAVESCGFLAGFRCVGCGASRNNRNRRQSQSRTIRVRFHFGGPSGASVPGATVASAQVSTTP